MVVVDVAVGVVAVTVAVVAATVVTAAVGCCCRYCWLLVGIGLLM